jgi:hypothetical protein
MSANKDPLLFLPFPEIDPYHDPGLHFFDGNRSRGADFDATLKTQTFMHIGELGLAVFDLQHSRRIYVHALTFSVALILVDGYFVHLSFLTSSIIARLQFLVYFNFFSDYPS